MKRIDEILYKMCTEIEANYGLRNAVKKITISHEAFDRMVFDMAKQTPYSARVTPASMNDFEICGIRIEARGRNET